jgi:hypothetical protein
MEELGDVTHLSICYFTCRLDPKIEWFVDSFAKQCEEFKLHELCDIKLVIVDFHADSRSMDWVGLKLCHYIKEFVHTTPKPTVWQGKHRLTKENWFAASNARNTAICLAPDGYIAFVDDLSVLRPGWVEAVRDAMHSKHIVLGTYKKVKKLVVEDGLVMAWEEWPSGNDSRAGQFRGRVKFPAAGSWLFGCSLVAPVEAFLDINGFDEDCDGLSSEDYIAGIMLEKRGWEFRMDTRMMTFESEEDHVGTGFRREDKGKSPNDKSHAILNMVLKGGRTMAPNYFGAGGIREMRAKILAGGEFPERNGPSHDWFDGQLLSEL